MEARASQLEAVTRPTLYLSVYGRFAPADAIKRTLDRLDLTADQIDRWARGSQASTSSTSARIASLAGDAEELVQSLRVAFTDMQATYEVGLLVSTLNDLATLIRDTSPYDPPAEYLVVRDVVGKLQRLEKAWLSTSAPTLEDSGQLFISLEAIARLIYEPKTAPLRRGFEHPSTAAIRRFHYGSPWQVDLAMGFLTGGSLVGLLYGFKRVCGLDLEIRVRRAQLRAELLEAKQRIAELENPSDRLASEPGAADHEFNRRTSQIDFFPWLAEGGALSDDPEE